MGKKEKEVKFIEYDKPELTRIAPGTNFVINHKSGKIMFLFRKVKTDLMIERLILKGYIKDVSCLRKNAYGDLLIMKL